MCALRRVVFLLESGLRISAADFAMADQALENSARTCKKASTEHDAAKVGNSAQRSACAARRRERSSGSEGLSQRRFENNQKPAALR